MASTTFPEGGQPNPQEGGVPQGVAGYGGLPATPQVYPGPDPIQPIVSPVWQTYLSVEEDVKPYLLIPAENPRLDRVLHDLTDMACVWVQNYLGRPIAPTTFFRRFDGWTGWNGSIIHLPYYPVLQIITVAEWWGNMGPNYLTEQIPANQGSAYVFQCDYLRGTLIRTFPGLVQQPWFPGSRNIEVTWTAGYNPVLADVRIATLELINYWYRNTQEFMRTQKPLQEYDADSGSRMLWPAVPNRVTQLLQAYTQVGIG